MAQASGESGAIATSPEAGPSRQAQQRPRTNSLNATVSRDSQAERADVDHAIDVKRRKSSFFAGVHVHSKFGSTRKRANTHGSHHDQDHPEPQPETRRPNGENQKGAVVGDVSDPHEMDEGRETEEEIQRLIREAEEAQAAGKKEYIAILKDNRPFEPDQEESFPPREYVWDGMFNCFLLTILS